MEEILKGMAMESPQLVGTIILVSIFLRALHVLIKSNRDTLKDRDDTIKIIASDFANASRAHSEEMGKLAENIGAHTEAIRRCEALNR